MSVLDKNESAISSRLFVLYLATISLEFACSLVDRMSFFLVDLLFGRSFDVAYLIHSFNGPFGLLATVLIMRDHWHTLDADKLISNWDNILTALTVIIICLCGKNWLTRKQYVYLLEKRFADKMVALNSKIIMLSELAWTKPPTSTQLQPASFVQHERNESTLPLGKAYQHNTFRPFHGENHSPTNLHGTRFADKIVDVFQKLVDSSMDHVTEESLTKKQLYKQRKSFWQ